MEINLIKKPVLLVDERICRENIAAMSSKAQKAGVMFRPHFKTHQSAHIGNWYREAGVDMMTVSSVTMCDYFMKNGWNDITIAFPANPREISDFNRIADKISLNILVTDYEQLVAFSERFYGEVGVFIKIDTGYKRSGIDWNHYADLVRICEYVNEIPSLRMQGLLTHAGNSYSVRGREKVLEVFDDAKSKLLHTKDIAPVSDLIISMGDTPTCSIATDFTGIGEMRPGNFVFYDLMQSEIGSCTLKDVAVAVACPVVSINRHRDELILYGGAVHLSKDSIVAENGEKIFGKVFMLTDEGWDIDSEIGYIRSLSQEHGIVKITSENGRKMRPGDIAAVIPVHSCLTADMLRSYLTLEGVIINDFSGK